MAVEVIEMEMKKRGRLLPANMYIPLALTLFTNMCAYYGTRLFTKRRVHYDLTIWADEQTPVVPVSILIYLGCYLYWGVNYIIGIRQDEKTAYRFISADFLAKLCCMALFLAFPTTNVRPQLAGTGIFERLLAWLYTADAADNLFPSIHCLTSWFCYIAVRENPKIPKGYRVFSFVFTMAVCLSTLTTKQHVILDVFGGIFLAEGCYRLSAETGFGEGYAKWTKAGGRWLLWQRTGGNR